MENLKYYSEEEISQFATDLAGQDSKNSTTPSAVALGGTKEIDLHKLNSSDIEKYLWMHGAVPRGIQIRANRMTERGYKVSGNDEDYREYCERIIENSGGITDINQWIQDGFGFGNGFRTLATNSDGTEVVRLIAEHPIYFDIKKHTGKDDPKKGKYMISDKTRLPEYYTQMEWSSTSDSYIETGKPIPSDRVAHLVFDKWGDEIKGISLVQYIHNVLKYLLNIEEAGAENIWRNGFTQKKVTSGIKSPKDLKKLGKSLKNLNSRDAVILPDGIDVENLLPGNTQFPEFHSVFLTLVAIRLGIPKPLLMLDGTDTNKATLQEQRKDMRSDLKMDENIVKNVIENQVFVPACKLKFGNDFDINKVPSFDFNKYQTDRETEVSVMKDVSTYVVQFTNSAKQLADMGKKKEAAEILQYMMASISDDYVESRKVDENFVNGDNDGKQVQPENSRVPPASKELKDGDASGKED